MDILGYEVTKDQEKVIAEGIAQKEKEQEEQAKLMEKQAKDNQKQPGKQPPAPPNKAIIELDRWEKKVEKAGKMVTWHAVDLPVDTVKAITDGTLSFAEARNRIVPTSAGVVTDAAMVLEGIRLALAEE
jgi:hypothetical protein